MKYLTPLLPPLRDLPIEHELELLERVLRDDVALPVCVASVCRAALQRSRRLLSSGNPRHRPSCSRATRRANGHRIAGSSPPSSRQRSTCSAPYQLSRAAGRAANSTAMASVVKSSRRSGMGTPEVIQTLSLNGSFRRVGLEVNTCDQIPQKLSRPRHSWLRSLSRERPRPSVCSSWSMRSDAASTCSSTASHSPRTSGRRR